MRLMKYPDHDFEYVFQTIDEYGRSHYYPQPCEYVDGKAYYMYAPDSWERKHWRHMYWDNYTIRTVNAICRFDNPLWGGPRPDIFDIVYKYETTPKDGFSTTAFFDFEIFLMAQGYELHMGLLNVHSGRRYVLGDVNIYVDYGTTYDGEFLKFSVTINGGRPLHMPTKHDEFKSFIELPVS